jgi:hypothetical protein
MKKTVIFILLGLIFAGVTYSQVKVNFTLTNPRVENFYFVYDLNATVPSGQYWAVGSSNIRVNFTTAPANGLTVKADNPAINPNPNIHNANGYLAMTTTSVASGAAIGLNILTFNTSGFYRFTPGTYRLATIRWNRIDSTVLATMTFRVPPETFPSTLFDSTIQILYPASWTVTNPPGGVVVSVLNNTGVIPKVYTLYQNYPNPFNPSTTIKFDIPKSTYAKLIIYDILGREVMKLIDEKIEAGSYDISWDGSGYASGTYIYKLVTNDFTDIKKMILVK